MNKENYKLLIVFLTITFTFASLFYRPAFAETVPSTDDEVTVITISLCSTPLGFAQPVPARLA
jgi:hypothetical protein